MATSAPHDLRVRDARVRFDVRHANAPERIQELMYTMNRPALAHVDPEESDPGAEPDEPTNG